MDAMNLLKVRGESLFDFHMHGENALLPLAYTSRSLRRLSKDYLRQAWPDPR